MKSFLFLVLIALTPMSFASVATATATVPATPVTPVLTASSEINALMTRTKGLSATFSFSEVDQENWINLMVTLPSSGYQLTFQVDTTDMALSNSNLITLKLDGGAYVYIDSTQTLRAVGPNSVSALMTANEEASRYFCLRSDGDASSGVLVKGMATVIINGTSHRNVLFRLRRDGLEQAGQYAMSDGTTGQTQSLMMQNFNAITATTTPTKVDVTEGPIIIDDGETKEEWVWVISWFSDDCKRAANKDCSPNDCSLTLGAALDIAREFGVSIPGGSTLGAVIDLLVGEGIAAHGECNKVYFLGIVSVGCQCVFFTFD